MGSAKTGLVVGFVAALALGSLPTGCASKRTATSDASQPTGDFGGIYTGDGDFGLIAFADDSTYYWRRASCTTLDCTELGAWILEADGTRIHLVSTEGDDRSLPLEILEVWSDDVGGALTGDGAGSVMVDGGAQGSLTVNASSLTPKASLARAT